MKSETWGGMAPQRDKSKVQGGLIRSASQTELDGRSLREKQDGGDG